MDSYISFHVFGWVPAVYLNKCDLLNKYVSTNSTNVVSLTKIDLNFPFNQLKKLNTKKLPLTKNQTQVCFFFLFFFFCHSPRVSYLKFKTVDDFAKECRLSLVLESPYDQVSFLKAAFLEVPSKKKSIALKKSDLIDSKAFCFIRKYSLSKFFELDDFLKKLNITSNDLLLTATFHFENKDASLTSNSAKLSKVKLIQNSYLLWLA